MAGRLFIAFSLIFALLAGGCNGFSKIQKSTDLNLKFTKAKEYYASGDYVKAQMLFDELYAVMRNTNNGEDVLFYLAYSNYKLGDYILAGYQFRVFYRSYPLSARAEECLYMSAYCHYLISPSYSLDQYDTYLAIDQFQYFVQMFPNSERVKECNKLIDALREVIFRLDQQEEKKEQRIKEALTQYNSFAAQFPESEFSGDAKTFYDKIIKLQNDFNEDKKSR